MKPLLSRCTCNLLGIFWLSAVAIGQAAPTKLEGVRVVALSNQQASGAPAGKVFKEFGPPVISDTGRVAFDVRVATAVGAQADRYGYWYEAANGLNMAALEGAQPGGFQLNSDIPSGLGFAFNDYGLAFSGNLVEGASGKIIGSGVWLSTPAGLQAVAITGQTMPSEPQERFAAFRRPTINESGTVAFSAIGTTPDPSCCGSNRIWTYQSGQLSSAFKGAYGIPRINSSNRLAFFIDNHEIQTNVRGFYETVAREGQPAPGFPPDATIADPFYGGLLSLLLNDRGDVIVFGRARGADITGANDGAIWRFRDGALGLIAREGGGAPGLTNGVVFDSFDPAGLGIGPVATWDSGDVAFFSRLVGPGIDSSNRASIWHVHDQEPELLVQAGSQAPGFAENTSFTELGFPIMNGLGQVAFHANVIGSGDYPDGGSHSGIWAVDSQGKLQLIVRDGDTIDADPQLGIDLRTVAQVELVAGSQLTAVIARGDADQPFAFNDRGQIAFVATFTDSSRAILVSNLLFVPEPNGCILVLFAAFSACCLTPRRSHRSA